MHITWYGHSAFALSAGGRRVLIDPFLTGNPVFETEGPGSLDAKFAAALADTTDVVVTHGHADHIGDCLEVVKRTGARLFCNWDLGQYLAGKWDSAHPGKDIAIEMMNAGGCVDHDGVSVRLVRADHSAGVVEDGRFVALGNAHGAIVSLPGAPKVYHMGDTDIFSDMALIDELYAPEVIIVPIGDRFTMGPDVAALAVRRYFPRAKAVVACHFRTFGALPGTLEAFRAGLGPMASRLLDLVPHQAQPLALG